MIVRTWWTTTAHGSKIQETLLLKKLFKEICQFGQLTVRGVSLLNAPTFLSMSSRWSGVSSFKFQDLDTSMYVLEVNKCKVTEQSRERKTNDGTCLAGTLIVPTQS